MNTSVIAGLGVLLVILALIFRWRWRATCKLEPECPPCPTASVVHRLCPHNNVLQRYEVEQKDSLEEHLEVLTKKLADKECRLRVNKSRIRETQNEMENLHAIDQDVRSKYREIMDALRTDLMGNEKECKKLQEQIEWVSRRRAELRDEVRRGHRLYGEAAAELASNLAELQRGRLTDHRVTEKPQDMTAASARLRKEPQLPRATPVGSIVLKSSPPRSIDKIMPHIERPQ